uniref:ENT domain-containing protein n=1 Tax=Meloidogyne enterolobii TaxID=390850 RepID=A0A6V7TQT8_MELEN|nr:unnamed protein product [Meloidogyne enterolobii]
MQPSTSAVQNLASNILDEKDLEEEDAKFLLKALEKQAFEHVLYAFRAQGPLTKYKELILEHLKSALFITDQEFSLNLRIAANNPYLNEIVQKLNPSYDNFSEWLAAGLDLTGAELANSRRQQSNNNNSTLSDHSTQILREIRRHNRNLSRESNVASEAIAELYQLPKRPFMPERLRKLLRDTEADGAVVDIPTETIKKEKSEILPQITTKTTTTTTTKPTVETKQIKKRNVGRPRKYPRKEETNNNNNNNEQHKQQEKHQQTKEETQKQINNNNNHNTNNINCFKGKIWGNVVQIIGLWKDSDDTIKKEEKIASTFSSSIFANKIPEHLNNSFKQIYSSTSNNSVPINNHIIQPSTSTNVTSCSTEAMENLADLALAQLAEFPLIPSSSTSVSSSILMPPPPLPPPPPINITSINTSTISTQIYGISNNLKSTITKNELFQQPNNNNKFNSQHKKDVKNDSDSIDEKIVKILKEQLGAEGTSFVVNACARVRPFVFERDIQKQKQQQYGKAENKSNFHSSSNPLPYLLKPSTLLRYSNNKSIIDKTTTNNSLTTKYISPSSSNCVDVIVDVVDDSHLYNETKNKDNLDDYIQIENDGDFIKNKCKQGKEQNGFVVGVAAADGSGGAVADVGGSGEEMKMDVSSVVQPSHTATTTTTSAPTLFSTKIIQNIPVLIDEEESGLDFLASTASLLQPIEMNKSNSENNKGNLFNEQNMSNNNKQRHSTFTK